MRPTVPQTEACFRAFNALCFGGTLPNVPVAVCHARTFLGRLVMRRKGGLWRSHVDYLLEISDGYDLTQAVFEDTVLHEMIHLHVAVSRLSDTSPHGPVFRRIMDDLNRRFGRHVTVSCRPKDGLLQPVRPRDHYVGLSELPDGRTAIVVCSAGRMPWLDARLPAAFGIRPLRWYRTQHPFFDRYPHARTLRMYPVDAGALALPLAHAEAVAIRPRAAT